ncbi:MAG: hypothetical protein AUJ52_13650 [Elusimicrobia bacterium CG1_02_63_36]|nr:MAG: hypothetical protein AUJ52_13650 [Elusimicrobia bacterium CG1_02_63_36]PIP82249.1 MAG: hypothetical protein COR54_15650 [Elusimicrobia bacterium CG22_combo_CG10-13_8_21_14_all_63_91]PJA15332.1 MAG: hypothetical protein COX66_10440 [Elusimicrobia bacterium CG_4_10_14_0_2_um_filter_63_34]PJB26983.1 MAG: hypothetical protein CO113_00760 [Elusimicrobia bacterium CG_4_9_14_3_um_filter_62_55]
MTPAVAGLALLLAASASAAPDDPTGWIKGPASLLLYTQDGVIQEIGLGKWKEETAPRLIRERETRGGVSRSGRFAWYCQKADLIRRGRDDEVLSSSRTFAYLGTEGQTLWKNDIVDVPGDLDPVALSDDGETILVIERGFDGWRAAAYSFTGNRLLSTAEFERIERFALTRNGRYAMVLASGIDKPLLYTFIEIQSDARKEIPAADALLGEASLSEDGRVLFGSKTVFRFP